MAAIAKTIEPPLCAICTEDILPVHKFYDAHVMGRPSKFRHLFHQACIEPWIARHETLEKDAPCPICRVPMHEWDSTDPDEPVIDTRGMSYFQILNALWSRKRITIDCVDMAIKGRMYPLLFHIANRRPDADIAELAKEAAYTHQWNVLKFLVTHRLPAIKNSPEYSTIRDCAVRNNQTELAREGVEVAPCSEPCCRFNMEALQPL